MSVIMILEEWQFKCLVKEFIAICREHTSRNVVRSIRFAWVTILQNHDKSLKSALRVINRNFKTL